MSKSTGVCSWGCPGRLWCAPVRARCGGGAAAWVAGVLAAPGTQGSWQLGQPEIQYSRRVWQPALANMLQYSCLENPPSLTENPGRPQSTGSRRVGYYQSDPACIGASLFCLWQLWPSESWTRRWGSSCLAYRDPGGAGCRDRDCLRCRSYGPIRVFEPLVAANQKACLASLSP